MNDPWGYYNLDPGRQAQLLAYHVTRTQQGEDRATLAPTSRKATVQVLNGKATPGIVAQAEAWAASNAPKEWSRKTGSAPEAIDFWTS